MILAFPIRYSARAWLQRAKNNHQGGARRVINIRIASANPVWRVQEVPPIAERAFGILIDRDDDRLYGLIAVAFQCRLPSHVGQRLDPRWMVRLVIVPF